MSVTVTCLHSFRTDTSLVHAHNLNGTDYTVLDSSDLYPIQNSIRDLSSEWSSRHNELREKVSESIKKNNDLQSEIKSAIKMCEDVLKDFHTTIDTQLSDGSPFFSTFSKMIDAHVSSVQKKIEEVRLSVQKCEELFTKVETFSSVFYEKCDVLEKEISTAVSGVKLETGSGLTAIKKEISAGKETVNAAVRAASDAEIARISNLIKDELTKFTQMASNAQQEISVAKDTVAQKTAVILDASKKFHDDLEIANSYATEFRKMHAFWEGVEPQFQIFHQKQTQLNEQFDQELQIYEQMKSEKVHQCEGLDQKITLAEGRLDTLLSAHAIFQDSSLSFFQRFKWLLTGRI